jgi:NAD-dependent SIR2 family protein deacetylase
MFIVGTSLNVGPVTQLSLYAKRNGLILIEINPELLFILNSRIIQSKVAQQKFYHNY